MPFKKIEVLFSPLEQFEVIPFLGFTNFEVSWMFTFSILSVTCGLILVNRKDSTLRIVPNSWQIFLEDILFTTILFMTRENIGVIKGTRFFPLMLMSFLSILITNLIGLVPYSSTVLSQLIITTVFGLFFFVGINVMGFKKHGLSLFLLIHPAGITFSLAFLLIPMELISYLCKPISLSVRLFANLVGGHTLLKVIASFGFILMNFTGVFFVFHYFPLLILVPLFFLELAVAFIQAFVFSTLICIYIYDGLYLH
jgi:ATP synthase subunit 6